MLYLVGLGLYDHKDITLRCGPSNLRTYVLHILTFFVFVASLYPKSNAVPT